MKYWLIKCFVITFKLQNEIPSRKLQLSKASLMVKCLKITGSVSSYSNTNKSFFFWIMTYVQRHKTSKKDQAQKLQCLWVCVAMWHKFGFKSFPKWSLVCGHAISGKFGITTTTTTTVKTCLAESFDRVSVGESVGVEN